MSSYKELRCLTGRSAASFRAKRSFRTKRFSRIKENWFPPRKWGRGARRGCGAYAVLLVTVCLQFACAAVSSTDYDGGHGDVLADAPPRDHQLELVSAGSLGLVAKEEAMYEVLYRGPDGLPVAGAMIDVALVGEANDSSLESTVLISDASGQAAVTLIAGVTSAVFRVRFSAVRAESLFLDVRVGALGSGAAKVTLSPDGIAGAASTRVFVIQDAQCAPDVIRLPSVTEIPVAPGLQTVRFVDLKADNLHAFAAQALDQGEQVLGFGCSTGSIVANEEITVEVPIKPIEK